MKKLLILTTSFLLLLPVHASDDLQESLNRFACGMGSIIGDKSGCPQVIRSRRVRPNNSKADKFIAEFIRKFFPSMRVRKMSFSTEEESEEEEKMMPGVEIFSKDACLVAVSYDLHFLEAGQQPSTLFMPLCRDYICHEVGLDKLKKYMSDYKVEHIRDPAAFFGCVGSGIDI